MVAAISMASVRRVHSSSVSAPLRMFSASKSDQNKQAMFIDDEQTIRDALDRIRVITIQTSVDGKPDTLTFEVGGFDRTQLERHLQ